MSKIFYHNLTARQVNLDIELLVINMQSTNDLIMYTEAGNALLQPLTNEMRDEIWLAYREYHSDEDNS